jgi:pimeloyl-ACP methyl ester carboxylesterase
MYSEVAGSGPPVVLIHEGVADSRMWDPQWETFPRAHRTVRMDLRGYGRTPLEPGEFWHARDVLAVLDEHGIERAALVGASIGGYTALEIAVAAPERVSALVVLGAPHPDHEWSAEADAEDERETAAVERRDLDAAVAVTLRMWVDGTRPPGSADPAVAALVEEMQRRAYELQLPVLDAAEAQELVPDLGARLGEIAVPTLVAVGEHDIPDIVASAERLAADIPGALLATLPGGAHLVSLERPAAFDALVLGFLAGR